MATPKKKHLIELMIEAGVKWPEGAEYAAQDNRDLYVWFYSEKPKFAGVNKGKWTSDVNYENGRKCRIVDGEKLNEICRNWHQTIVTREQYAEAVAASGNHQQEQQPHSGVAGVMPSKTIELLFAEIKAKREDHNSLVAKTDELALEIASIEQKINEKLKGYGLVAMELSAQLEPEQPVITDWRDLRAGDVIWLKGDSKITPGEYTVERIERADYTGDYPILLSVEGWVTVSCEEWCFIRRP